MNRFLKSALLALMLLTLCLQAPILALEAFTISSYNINMVVNDDNSYNITETIDVTFSQSRRGIIRDIPILTTRRAPARINNINVQGRPFTTYKEGNFLALQIGDPNRYANANERYVVSYNYEIGDDGLPNTDELYFNLIGPYWDTYIENVTFKIQMPHPFDSSNLNFTYGDWESTDNKDVSYTISGNTISGRLNTRLTPGQSLTVALPLPQGYYTSAKKILTFESIMRTYHWIIYPLLLLFGILIWLKWGKNGHVIQTVEFYPPKDLTSADIGYVFDGELSNFDVTSLIVYWANKGYLSIEEKKPQAFKNSFLELTKLKDLDDDAKGYERTMFNAMFDKIGDGTKVDTATLKNSFYQTLRTVKDDIIQSFQGSPKTSIFVKSAKAAKTAVFFLALAIIASMIYVLFSSSSVSASLPMSDTLVDLLFSPLVLFALLFVIAPLFSQLYKKHSEKSKYFKLGAQITMILIITGLAAALYWKTPDFYLVIDGILASGALIALGGFFNKRTDLGNSYLGKIQGFKKFLEVAEKDRIRVLAQENPNYFYDVLPYTMVLGVSDFWAEKFKDIGISVNEPTWYSTYNARPFDLYLFSRGLNATMVNTSRTLSSTPQPTSSGPGRGSFGGGSSMGGGFSGGGSGGGGGRSW